MRGQSDVLRRTPATTLVRTIATRGAVVLLALGAAAGAAGAQQSLSVDAPLASNSFVLRDVRVFDARGAAADANVVVRSGRVSEVGPAGAPSDLPVVRGLGYTLLPGSVDSRGALELSNGGRITKGAPADFVLVEGYPPADSAASRVIVRAFRNGYDAGRPAPDATRQRRRRWPCE
jgi:hypothetical protein